ncbi:MAG: ABC transporter permease [Chthoniobacteraceae bacterium]
MNRYFREWSVAGALAAALIALGILAPNFYDAQPLLSRLTRETPVLLVACGMALVIISRQIDISVGSIFAVCGVCAGMLAVKGLPLAVVAVVSIAAGAALGAINGALVAGLGLPSIVVTLATMVAWREALRWKTQGQFVNLPAGTQWFGLDQTGGQTLVILVGAAIFIGLAWATRNIAAARRVYAVGSNAEAARLAGIRPRATTFGVFVLLGALTGFAALLNVVQSPQVDPKSGTGLELRAIAACVVGGVAISGARGNLWGVLMGFLLLACINPALIHLRVEAYWEKAIQGAIILLAVLADGLRQRAGKH